MATDTILAAHLNGTVVPLAEVDDPVFSSEMLGKGVAIEPSEGKLFAPADATVQMVMDTKHAIGLASDDGVEILLHIGIDTVNLKGENFETHVQAEQKVKKGDLLISFDIDGIKAAGYKCTTPMIISNTADYADVCAVASGDINAGADLLSLKA